MDTIRILCYGDSNTWGYISDSLNQRFTRKGRWTGILQELLGNKFEVIEEGLKGRTLISNDEREGCEGRNGFEYLIPCLDSHDPLDLVVLMLGTNELKDKFNRTAKDLGEILERYYVRTILSRKNSFRNNKPQLLIIAPPIINGNTDFCKNKYENASQKSIKINDIYKEVAKRNNCYFIDNSSLEIDNDGVHITKNTHKVLANEIAEKINKLFE